MVFYVTCSLQERERLVFENTELRHENQRLREENERVRDALAKHRLICSMPY